MKKEKFFKQMKSIVSLVVSVTLLFSVILITNSTVAHAAGGQVDLPENILIDKQDFDTIPDVIQKYEALDPNNTTYFVKVNGESRIQRINFIDYKDEHIQIDGSMTFDIPEEVAKVARFFGDIRFEGDIASDMQVTLVNPKGESFEWQILEGHYWADRYTGLATTYVKTGFFASRNTGLLEPWIMRDGNGNMMYDGYKLIIHGTGTLKDIYIWEEAGVDPEYDISGYTIIGEDKPWLDVKIDADATKNLSINGQNKLDESKFKRYHINSGPVNLGGSDTSVTLLDRAYQMIERDYGFLPGRGAFHFTGLEQYQGLVEDPNRPGYTDFTAIDALYARNDALINKYDTLFPTIGNDYTLVYDLWPSWTWEDPNVNMGNGTPALDKFDSASEIAARILKAINTRFDGRGPKYLEVKNESTISIEWPYFNSDSDNAWNYLSDFHNQMADAIKEENPGTLVGGPSTAFTYLEQNNFDEARNHLKFMDDTKGKLDCFIHHFYENGPMFINDEGDNPDGFLGGRLEAVFDLLNNHMVLTDNVRPILITEEGSYNSGKTFIDYFKKLRTSNGYMLRFMNLTDSIDMIVPYLYPIINWRPDADNSFYKYNANQTGLDGTTPMIHYLDMWKDYRGALIPVKSDNDQVYTHATRYENKIYVAVQNLSQQRVYIDLDIDTGDANITNVKRKHTYIELGELVHEEVTVDDINQVPMRVEEMSVFEITLDSEPQFTNTLLRKTYYGDKTLQETGATPSMFTITCDTNSLENSLLRVGFGKTGSGFQQDMTVTINGQVFTKDLEYTNKSGDLFTYAEFEVDKSYVNATNTITISIPEDGGYISSTQLINEYLKPAPTGVQTTALKALVEEAKVKCDSVKVSVNGFDLLEGDYWVTEEVKDSFQYTIKCAEIVANDFIATQDEVDKASSDLIKMDSIFTSNIQERPNNDVTFPRVSFEEEETLVYSVSDSSKAVCEVVYDDGVTHGTNALKLNITSLNKVDDGNFTVLDFNAPTGTWNFGFGNSLKLDVTNPQDYGIQVRVNITDIAGTTGTYYFYFDANESRILDISQFGQSEPEFLTDGYWGLGQKGLNTAGIKEIRVGIFEAYSSLANEDSCAIIVDNIHVPNRNPNAIKVSFEDGETLGYSINAPDNAVCEVIQDNGVTHGTNALNFNVTSLNKDDNGISTLFILNNDIGTWDFGIDSSLKMDVTNPQNYPMQMRVSVTDNEGTTGTYYFAFDANESRTMEISQYGKSEPVFLVDGYWGLNEKGLNAEKIKTIRIGLWEAHTSLENEDSSAFIIDNIRIPDVKPNINEIPLHRVSFEDDEPVGYSVSDPDKVDNEVVQDKGVTHGTNSLQFNVTSLNKVDDGVFSALIFNNSAMWDFGDGNSLLMDITNPQDHPIQMRVLVTDDEDTTGTYYFYFGAQASRTLAVSQFEKSEAVYLEDGYWGLEAKGINIAKIKTINVTLWEAYGSLQDVDSCAFIIDNIRIPDMKLNTTALEIAPVTFDAITYGDPQPVAKQISISNTGDTAVTIKNITVSNTDFIIQGSGETVPAGGTLETWCVRPANNLSAGTHQGTIIITYDQDKTVTASVSIIVNQSNAAVATLTGPSTAKQGDTMTLDYNINGVVDITAHDIVIGYESDVFEFIDATSLLDTVKIWGMKDENGKVEIMLASNGASNAITGNMKVFNLEFIVKSEEATSQVDIIKAEMSNVAGEVTNAGVSTFTVSISQDNNQTLIDLISTAQTKLDEAVEGMNNGEYPAGAKARLSVVINEATQISEDDNATQAQIDVVASDLQAAYDKFINLVITESTGDFNGNNMIDVGDLGMVAAYYGVSEGDPDWSTAQNYDIDGDGDIDMYEMTFIVLKKLGM